ncbi:MAG: WD40 repeat domain-containing protein [Bacteroidota bacterium]|nr:WD40 repeat domain-containing protein [Bacteroidota bacterium]MDP3144256.1 WD40 repeat domain-containing protein [Bacteroidota bacterium]
MKKNKLIFLSVLILNSILFKAQDSLVATLLGHSGPINSFDISLDNKWLISGSKDETLRLWNLENFSNTKTISNFGYSVKRVNFNSKGDKFLVATYEIFSEFDFAKLKKIRTKKKAHTTFLENCSYSPNDEFIVTSSWRDKTLVIWKASSLKKQSETPEVTWVDNVIFNKASNLIISGGHNDMIKIWDVATGGLIKQFAGHEDWVYDICLSTDEKYIYSGSLDKTIKIWDIASGKQITTLKGHTDGIICIDLCKDGKYLASAGIDKEIIIWDLSSKTIAKKFPAHDQTIMDIKFGKDSNTLYSASMDKTIKVWKLNLPSN